MICKKNVCWLYLFLFLSIGIPSFSQSQWTYDFNNGLNPIESGGISLKMLGQPGQYVKEKIPGTEDLFRTTYRFETNSGLQFNNTEAKGFLNKSFTVEIYFKLDTLGSWKRVLDFKNRKSDYGCYIYDGKLNFYDFAISEKAPIRRNQYLHYVYSRDFETKTIKMYINGLLKLEFKDPGTEGVLDQDQVLNLFQDDLIANHEASAGSVALIRIYDRVMTPVFIRRSFQSINKAKPPVEVAEKEPVEEIKQEAIKEEAKAPSNLVSVSGRVYDGRNLKPVQDASVSVRQSKDDLLVTQTKTIDGLYVVELKPYESYKISVDAVGFQSKSMPVKTSGKSQEVKSLFNLSPESYESPIVTIYFPQSLEEMEGDAKTKLDSMVSYFNVRKDLRILLKGHTDNMGDFDKNIALSRQRVETVKNYLVERGIPADRIEGTGYGPARPNAQNQTETQKQRNRRVEVWAEPIKR
ncbi:OmpA family protein [Dyadobacter sp. CY312]|uniref:OmpA family protein n=1 Tax=Dyadobacter sp. CY312 TaxID=2907303 RepID=UPI001F21EBF4|nr:OmpA family protein [Dyadobacter sp. CY312]MCE7040726.1 OmpA family protein [Dyadobacter sp. CY312]